MLHLLLAVLNECVKRPGVTEVLLARHNLPRQTFYHQTHETHTTQRPLRGDNEYVTSTRKEKKSNRKCSLFVLCSFLSLTLTCIVRHGTHRWSHVAFRRRLNLKEMEVGNPERRMDMEESVHAANASVKWNQRHNAGWSI